MSRRNRVLPLATCALTLAALTACAANPNEGKAAPANSSTAAATGAPLEAAEFVNPLPQYPAWRTIGDCMKDAATARGIDFTESGPTGGALDATKMIQQIQQ